MREHDCVSDRGQADGRLILNRFGRGSGILGEPLLHTSANARKSMVTSEMLAVELNMDEEEMSVEEQAKADLQELLVSQLIAGKVCGMPKEYAVVRDSYDLGDAGEEDWKSEQSVKEDAILDSVRELVEKRLLPADAKHEYVCVWNSESGVPTVKRKESKGFERLQSMIVDLESAVRSKRGRAAKSTNGKNLERNCKNMTVTIEKLRALRDDPRMDKGFGMANIDELVTAIVVATPGCFIIRMNQGYDFISVQTPA